VELTVASLKDMEGVLEGIGVQLAVQVAPWITAAVDAMKDLGVTGSSTGGVISHILKDIAYGVARGYQGLLFLELGWGVVKLAVQGFAWAGLKALEMIDRAAAAVTFGDTSERLEREADLPDEESNEVAAVFSAMVDSLTKLAGIVEKLSKPMQRHWG
jgi:hypothetical protein